MAFVTSKVDSAMDQRGWDVVRDIWEGLKYDREEGKTASPLNLSSH